MAVVWIVENPAPGPARITSLLCGFVAVRAFASVRSLMRVASCDPLIPGTNPRLILVDREQLPTITTEVQVADDIRKVVARNGWNEVQIIPVEPGDDVVERVRQALTIAPNRPSEFRTLQMGDLLLNLDACKASCRACGQVETLSPTEGRILRFLLAHHDRTITRQEVIGSVWNGVKIAPRNLDAHVSRLRKRIAFCGVKIESAYGDGYRISIGNGCEAASGRMATSRGGSTGLGRAAPTL